MTEQTTALAERQQHPLAEQLEKREAALAEMLPGGEQAARRFKRVVTQAVIRTPSLMECTQTNAGLASLMAATMEAAALGIEPTGVLGGAHLVPYKGKAQLIIGYRGLIELARRSGEIETIEARVVRDGDEFAYQYGTDAGVRHVPNLDAGVNRPLTYVYAVAKLRGGGVQFEVMTREQVDQIRAGSSGYKYAESKGKQDSPWHTSYDEMARKTVVRRIVKYLPIAVEARDLIERDDSREFDHGAVVARVSSDERSGQARGRIQQRAAAMRGESVEQGESEAVSDDGAVPGRQPSDASHGTSDGGSPVEEPVYEGEVLDVDQIPFDEPAGGKGDPWMRKIHAVGAERGLSHEDLHAIAAERFGVDSMSHLDTSERAELLDHVESIEHAEQGQAIGAAEDASSGTVRDPSPAPQSQARTGQPVDARPPAAPNETPDDGRAAAGEEPVGPVPATASAESPPSQPAPAQISDLDTLRTYAAAVLELKLDDVWGLGDLDAFDWDRVWASLDLTDHEAYAAWYGPLKRPLRQALMSAGQSPRKRKDRAIAAEAEQAIERVKAGAS